MIFEIVCLEWVSGSSSCYLSLELSFVFCGLFFFAVGICLVGGVVGFRFGV